jgi:hypothetical protein
MELWSKNYDVLDRGEKEEKEIEYREIRERIQFQNEKMQDV